MERLVLHELLQYFNANLYTLGNILRPFLLLWSGATRAAYHLRFHSIRIQLKLLLVFHISYHDLEEISLSQVQIEVFCLNYAENLRRYFCQF